jgi:dihydrofolate reductase
MKVSLIAAVAQNGVIGRNNDLPWKLPLDMRFFVATTRGHGIIMGRLNYESIGRPLPGRRNLVVSRNSALQIAGCEVVTSVPAALKILKAAGEQEAFIVGGAQIYAQALPYAHRFYRTRVLADIPGDVRFPEWSWAEWNVQLQSSHKPDESHAHAFEIELLTRKGEPRSFEQVDT